MSETRDRQRAGSASRRSFSRATNDLQDSTQRVVRAWSEATAEAWVGTARTIGDLMVGVTDAFVGGRSQRVDDDEDDDRPRRGSRGVDYDVSREVNDRTSAGLDTVGRALRDSARTLSRSASRFASVYDDLEHKDHDDHDDPADHAEHAKVNEHKHRAAEAKPAEKKA